MAAGEITDKTEATVSIIIPFFNRENFLAEAIESVLGQTFQSWELILIDDGSTDDSANIARAYVTKYPGRVSLYAHENNLHRGASSSRNLGVKYAKGRFITFLDSDDVFFPRTLEIEMAAFDQHPEADVVCGTLRYWFSWSTAKAKRDRDFPVNLGIQTNQFYEPPSLLVHNLRAGGRKPGMGCVILRSEFARQFDLFEDDFAFVGEDQIFWAKITLRATIYVLPDCLAQYRQHSNASTAGLVNGGKVDGNSEKFTTWLESYLSEKGVADQDILQALQLWRQECAYRTKYRSLLGLYQRVLPWHLRYRIRDLIVSWRMRK